MALTSTIGTSYDLQNGFVWPDGAMTVSVRPFQWEIGGVRGSYAGSLLNGVVNGLNYVYLDSAGLLQINIVGWPAGNHIRLSTVTAVAGIITAVTDERAFLTGGGGAPAAAEYVVGAADPTLPNEIVKEYMGDNQDPDVYPAAPSAWDDEFEGGGAIDVKWSVVNPGCTCTVNQSSYLGYLYVELPELTGGDGSYAELVQLSQTPPDGATTWEAKAKVSLVVEGCGSRAGEFATVGIQIGYSTGSDLVSANISISDSVATYMPQAAGGWKGYSGAPDVNQLIRTGLFPWVYIRLAKITANAYTASNDYVISVSTNGFTWFDVALATKTFAGNADRIGLFFQRPAAQTRDPIAKVLVDYFRLQ